MSCLRQLCLDYDAEIARKGNLRSRADGRNPHLLEPVDAPEVAPGGEGLEELAQGDLSSPRTQASAPVSARTVSCMEVACSPPTTRRARGKRALGPLMNSRTIGQEWVNMTETPITSESAETRA